MRFALMVEPQQGITWPWQVRIAQRAEEAGFDTLYRSDHYESFPGALGGPTSDGWATIAGLVGVTTTLRHGTLVSPVTFRHPGNVAKVVGVSDDYDAVSAATSAAHDQFGAQVSASTSQPYYLDVTHPQANKGSVAQYLAQRYGIATDEIATIGDMPNDVLMFAHSGLSIAMGNADPQVQRAARRVTAANDDARSSGERRR